MIKNYLNKNNKDYLNKNDKDKHFLSFVNQNNITFGSQNNDNLSSSDELCKTIYEYNKSNTNNSVFKCPNCYVDLSIPAYKNYHNCKAFGGPLINNS